MSIESSKVLRSGKLLIDKPLHSSTENKTRKPNLNMESSGNSADEINRSGRNSPTSENFTQVTNEERFNHLQNEMSTLKAMMEKIISQNEERDRQNGGSIETSSYAVGTSNMVTGVNRTHRNHRNQFHDDEYDEGYEDAPSNTTESARLNAIQDLPGKLQKSKHMYQISVGLKISTTNSNICYLITSDQSPTKSQKKTKSTSSKAYSVTKPSTFGKQSQLAPPPHCKMSSNYSEKKLQKKTCERLPDINGMKPNTTLPLKHSEIF